MAKQWVQVRETFKSLELREGESLELKGPVTVEVRSGRVSIGLGAGCSVLMERNEAHRRMLAREVVADIDLAKAEA